MGIRLIEGRHLTATNKRHMSEIISMGWTQGHSNKINYTLTPLEDAPNRYAFHLSKRESDDWGRPVIRESRGIIEYLPA